MNKKKQAIIESWINFSRVEDRNLQAFIGWASYYYEMPKSYIRNILAEYNLATEQEKREKEQKQIQEYEKMLNEILEEDL